MIFISQKELDNSQQFNELKRDLNDNLGALKDDIDDETLQKIKDLKEELKEKLSNNPSSDKKIEIIRESFYQRFKRSFEKDVDIDPGRLLGLTDGIFGMVMTLLVFGMALPEVQLLTSMDFLAFLQSIAPTFGVTIVSFILVSSFWIYHHEFIKINGLNMPYLWINIFYLASISFIPFTTSIIGAYSQFFLAEVIFGINISLTIFLFLIMYRYAYNRGFLENRPSKAENRYIFNTFIIIMALTIVVNLLDFNVSNNFIYLFLLVPVISTIRDLRL